MGTLIGLVPLPYADAVVAVGATILGVTAGVLGAFAVLRGRSLVGDALAHSALPGVAIAFLITGTKDIGALVLGAGIAGLVGALLMVGIERTSRIRPDAAIGVVLSSFFALGTVLLTYIAGQGNANQAGLSNFLFGQAAGLLERDLVVMGWLALAALTVVVVGFRAFKSALFDPLFAASLGLPVRGLDVAMTCLVVVAVVVGIQAVGAILMVALLVAPTVAARQLTRTLAGTLVLAGLIGAVVGVLGSLAATRAELPTGPVIVLVAFAAVLAAVLFAPGRGVLWRAGALLRERRRVLLDGVLVDLVAALLPPPAPDPTRTSARFVADGDRPARRTARALRRLRRAGLLAAGEPLEFTEAGARAARAAQQRRELWSLWLEHGSRLDLPDAREPDPYDLAATVGDDGMRRLRALAEVAR